MIIKKYESKAMTKGKKERGSWTLFRESFIKKLPKYTTMIVIVLLVIYYIFVLLMNTNIVSIFRGIHFQSEKLPAT